MFRIADIYNIVYWRTIQYYIIFLVLKSLMDQLNILLYLKLYKMHSYRERNDIMIGRTNCCLTFRPLKCISIQELSCSKHFSGPWPFLMASTALMYNSSCNNQKYNTMCNDIKAKITRGVSYSIKGYHHFTLLIISLKIVWTGFFFLHAHIPRWQTTTV